MVYSCGFKSPYGTMPSYELLDGKYEGMFEIGFANPDDVDPVANRPKHTRMNEGYRVNAADVPRKMQWGDKRKAVPDVIAYASTPIISERAKDIIEEFEPGVHQFIPIDLYYRKATEPFATHYWLVICKLIDTIDEEATAMDLVTNPDIPGVGMYVDRPGHKPNHVVSREKANCHHCWREKFAGRWWMMSSDIIDHIDKAALTGLGRTKLEEVA